METDRTSVIATVAKVLAFIVAALLSAFFFFVTFQSGRIGVSAVLGALATIFTAGWIFHLVLLMRGRPAALSEAARVGAMIATGILWVCAGGILIFSFAYLSEQEMISIWFAPACVAFVVFMTAELIRTVRRRRAALVLGYVDQAVGLALPLSPMILAAARSETGKTRSRLLQLHEELDRGSDLEDALRRAVPEVRPADLRSIGAAQRLGRLPHMLDRLAVPTRRTLTPASDITALYRVYPVIVLLMALATGGVMIPIAVLPKFEKILHDFHQPPPWSTGWMIHLVHQSYGLIGGPLFILIGLLALGPLGPYLARLFFPTRQDPPFGGLVRDQLIWWTPVLHGDVRDRGLADLCDFIADAAEAGRPLDQALRNAQQTQANAVMRWRVAQWADAIERGQSIHDAARTAHMPPLVVGMLATVRSVDDLGEVFAFLARYYEFRFSRRRELLRALYVPFIVAAMGAIVLLIALTVFQPMIALILAMTHFGGGF
jgi:MSHA biogenesis protein MshG